MILELDRIVKAVETIIEGDKNTKMINFIIDVCTSDLIKLFTNAQGLFSNTFFGQFVKTIYKITRESSESEHSHSIITTVQSPKKSTSLHQLQSSRTKNFR